MSYNIVRQFKKQFEYVAKKYPTEEPRLYVAIDIHETIYTPTHSTTKASTFYPNAEETLRMMTNHPQIESILWTSTLLTTTEEYRKEFAALGIKFDHINDNPSIPSPFYADFSKKFFMNVIIDDKAGFRAEEDWEPLRDYFELLRWRQHGKLYVPNIDA